MFRWTVAEEVPASGLDIFGKNMRKKCKVRIDNLEKCGKVFKQFLACASSPK